MDRVTAFLVTARTSQSLLNDSAVAAGWTQPSALPGFTVGGLAEHLAGQILTTARVLSEPPSTDELVPISEHYARAAWVGADRDAEPNVTIRNSGEQAAAEGHTALAVRVEQALAELEVALRDEPPDRWIRPPAGPWSLSLEDFLLTRMMEMVVHCDDLACSLDLTTPPFPAPVQDPVLELLVGLSGRRHGAMALVRALTRAERAPSSISAF
jgi:Mycothiol maleylpyruvate isomerase N-terminal domain